MQNNIVLSSLAMDLKRVALGLHRKSYGMADAFMAEAKKRKNEVNRNEVQPYINKILDKIDHLTQEDVMQRAETALLLSQRIQNYVLHNQ